MEEGALSSEVADSPSSSVRTSSCEPKNAMHGEKFPSSSVLAGSIEWYRFAPFQLRSRTKMHGLSGVFTSVKVNASTLKLQLTAQSFLAAKRTSSEQMSTVSSSRRARAT